MELGRLNQYRVMWVFVFFDLPTKTAGEKKHYTRFRKKLLHDGFQMLQYSIYIRHCASYENASVHNRRVKSFLPPKGEVIIFHITDRQFGLMETFNGYEAQDMQKTPQQLELF